MNLTNFMFESAVIFFLLRLKKKRLSMLENTVTMVANS